MINSLESRFNTDSAEFFKSLECFAVGKSIYVKNIVTFHKDDFDEDGLMSDREIFLELVNKQNKKVTNSREVANFLQEYDWSLEDLFLIMLDLFVCWWRFRGRPVRTTGVSPVPWLKNYLRSTMQNRLNNVAQLYSKITRIRLLCRNSSSYSQFLN